MRSMLLMGLLGFVVVGSVVGDLLAGQVIAQKDPQSGEVVLANETIRMRFHSPGPGQ